jgi:MFS transporter, DHA2 family, methylenomycin A resistance protein
MLADARGGPGKSAVGVAMVTVGAVIIVEWLMVRGTVTSSRRKEGAVDWGHPTATRRARPDNNAAGDATTRAGAGSTLIAALLGFFMITLDAVAVNVALPSIQRGLGGGMSGLQWVIDGYTFMFAALLLSAGSLSDRIGARRAFATGLSGFVMASAACGLAPTLNVLVAGRLVQGATAAVIMPSSMALIREAYPNPARRRRAIAWWAMGAAVGTTSGPMLSGLLSLLTWRALFFVNLPVGAAALLMLARIRRSPRRPVPLDWLGQTTAVLAMGGLTYGVVEAGVAGPTEPRVLVPLAAALAALGVFIVAQLRGTHPMVPPDMVRTPTVIAIAIGFAFTVGYYGLPFVLSLYFQQVRGLSSLGTGVAFLPMMLIGAVLTPFSARIVERTGPRVPIVSGLGLMAVGSLALCAVPAGTPIPVLAMLLVLIGLAAPLVSPPLTAVLLGSVPATRAGTASGMFNTGRQAGGALAVAVFGTLLAHPNTFQHGMRISLLIAAVVVLATAATGLLLQPAPR